MAAFDPHAPDLWPSASQRLLLRALLLDGAPARAAWRQWSALHRLDTLDVAEEVLLPTLYLEVDRLDLEADVRARARAAYLSDWARNQLALHRLSDLLRRLEASGVPAVLLKGAALALRYYPDVGARTMADVDLLIHESHLSRAAEVLSAAGWFPPLAGPPPADLVPHMHAVSWAHPVTFSIDLHWRPFTVGCPAAAEERFWQRTQLCDSAFGRVRLPAAADLLILMCFHGRKLDRQANARWVVDAVKVIAGADPPIDWGDVLEQCRETGLLPPVRDALTYLKREIDAPIPEDFLDAAGKIPARRPEMMRYAYLTRDQVNARGLAEVVGEQWWRYAAGRRVHGHSVSKTGFMRYYVRLKQWEWNARGVRWMPLRAVTSVLRRFWSYGT